MRIAQVAPLAESVPPKLYGGTERVVSWLTDELLALGHEVTLFASGDSSTRALLVPIWPAALHLSKRRVDPVVAGAVALEKVAERASQFDIIHFQRTGLICRWSPGSAFLSSPRCMVDWTFRVSLSS